MHLIIVFNKGNIPRDGAAVAIVFSIVIAGVVLADVAAGLVAAVVSLEKPKIKGLGSFKNIFRNISRNFLEFFRNFLEIF